jgi:hypothetical protein
MRLLIIYFSCAQCLTQVITHSNYNSVLLGASLLKRFDAEMSSNANIYCIQNGTYPVYKTVSIWDRFTVYMLYIGL